jgi:hypothetical protein
MEAHRIQVIPLAQQVVIPLAHRVHHPYHPRSRLTFFGVAV